MTAIEDVLAERKRQIDTEGWTPEHDDQHRGGELVHAASCYALQAVERAWLLGTENGEINYRQDALPRDWPDSWAEEWWKPKNPRRDLVRAAAMLIAEIERIDRESTFLTQQLGGCNVNSTR